MNIQINTERKTLVIVENVKIKELNDFLESMPLLKDYKIISNVVYLDKPAYMNRSAHSESLWSKLEALTSDEQ
jgi:hypothetical protein